MTSPARPIESLFPADSRLGDRADYSPAEMQAAALLRQIARGEHAALEKLYQLWAPTLLGIALRMVKNRSDAEEIMQDAFVRIWNQAKQYTHGQQRPFVWAHMILRGLCIDRIRHMNRQKRRAPGEPPAFPLHLHEEPIVDSGIIAADLAGSIRQALDSMPAEERRCLELAVFHEFTHQEIQDQLDMPLGTVKGRLRRALESLRQFLSRHES
jgi:RNA polymerase sigma-70 factor (ECF subfamily)